VRPQRIGGLRLGSETCLGGRLSQAAGPCNRNLSAIGIVCSAPRLVPDKGHGGQ
jgi:hypothetical protein